MHQKEKIAPEIAAKIASVNGLDASMSITAGRYKTRAVNGDSAPDLCVTPPPHVYINLYNVNKNRIGKFIQKRAEKTKVKIFSAHS